MQRSIPRMIFEIAVIALFSLVTVSYAVGDTVKIALNYPETGPYAKEGKDEWYGAELARQEINAAGGILGREVSLE